jgi:phosphinothricin acetyltransferase
MHISIRKMEPADWPRVAEIYRQGIESGISTFVREISEYEHWDGRYCLNAGAKRRVSRY